MDMALAQGREVYALPGRATDTLSAGCNRLIRQGAALVTSPEELLEELQAALRPNPEKTVYCQQSLFEPEGLSGELLALLDFTPKPLDLLQEAYHRAYQTRIPVPRLCHGLLQLCADGYAGQKTPIRFTSLTGPGWKENSWKKRKRPIKSLKR